MYYIRLIENNINNDFHFFCRSPGTQNVLAKKILEYVLAHIVEFKKLNQEPRMGGGNFLQHDDEDDY